MSSITDNASSADNQQETLQVPFSPYYFTGFCSGEISFCLLKLRNRKSKTGGVYYTPDITISNADIDLLKEVNDVVAEGCGVLSKIKGGFNLSIRGKEKVKKVFAFFAKYPPIAGDLVLTRLALLSKAVKLLEDQKAGRRTLGTENQLEEIRQTLVFVKQSAIPTSNFPQTIFHQDAIGYFLSGILDAEGSVGLKSNGTHKQPFVAVAMKDQKVVELFYDFLKVGHIHARPKENMIHFEVGAKRDVLNVLDMFLHMYPSRLAKMRGRIRKLQWILNDYTLGSRFISGHDIV